MGRKWCDTGQYNTYIYHMTIINVSTGNLENLKTISNVHTLFVCRSAYQRSRETVQDEFAKINRILAKILLKLQSMNTGTVGGTTIDLNGDDEFQEIVSQFPITNVKILNDVNERVERDQSFIKK
uniref:Uncharacterized protein LOC114344846 n=1 Tax=Diabrotica virgifera virgifera TaxID=50390 RepID=A0A6P7H688_DIAVI